MKAARIEFELDGNKRVVTYEAGGPQAAVDYPDVPVLLVEVADAEDAEAVVAQIEKMDRPVKRRKRTSKEPGKEPEPEPPTAAAPDDPPCPAHADGRHVRTGGAPCACEPAAPDAVTPPAVGKTRAHRIREGVEGEPGKPHAA